MNKNFKNQQIKFLFNLLVLFVFVFLADKFVGEITKKMYFSQVAGTTYQTTYAIDSTLANLVVLGSSRASHHFVPEIFEKNLGITFFNAGRDGNFNLYSYAILKTITKRYTPKIIILEISPGELYINDNKNDYLSSLLPYYENHSEIRDIIELRDKFERFKLYSTIYPYNSILIETLTGNFYLYGIREQINKGFIPLNNQISDTTLYDFTDQKSNIDNNSILALKEMAMICKKKEIRFILVTSPLYANYIDCFTVDTLEYIASQNHFEYYNFINDTTFIYKPEYFQDLNHLNTKGAFVFSQILALKLNNSHSNNNN